MNPFEFSDRTLEDLERVQGARGAGRGKVDRRGIRKMSLSLGMMIRAPHELAFAGAGRVADRLSGATAGSRAQRNAAALRTIDRTAKRSPQVVVKITSRLHGAPSTLGAFTYVSRLGMSDKEPIDLVTSEGKTLTDARDMMALAREWQAWEQSDEARRKGATAIAMVFSMPPGTDPEKVREAVREFAESDMANRRWVMALHTDEDHPHVHLIIAGRDNDGRRFNPNRDFLQHCRDRFAENLRALGVEADATKRVTRGYPPKRDATPVLKMRERGLTPNSDARKMAALRRDGPEAEVHLAEREQARSKTAANVTLVREVYVRAIDELEAHGGAEQIGRARALRLFVDSMPEPINARDEIIERLKTGSALPGSYAIDRELEKLKARVQGRGDDQRQVGLDRLAAATGKVKALSAELKKQSATKKEDGRAIAPDERVKALKNHLAAERKSAPREPGPRSEASIRLEQKVREMERYIRDRELERDRSRDKDKDRGGPAR